MGAGPCVVTSLEYDDLAASWSAVPQPLQTRHIADVDAAMGGPIPAATGEVRRVVDGLAPVKEHRVWHRGAVDTGDVVLIFPVDGMDALGSGLTLSLIHI